MDDKTLDLAIKKIVSVKMIALDRLTKELIEPISDVGSPEKVLKKAYDLWDENDLALAVQIYGPGDDTPLANLIFRKTLERVEELEREEI